MSEKLERQVKRECPLCEEETKWHRKQTAFGDGYRCECKRVLVELEDMNNAD